MLRQVLVPLIGCAALWWSVAWAEAYPGRPVRLIVPFGAGAPDTVTRVLARELAARLGQPFVVENRAGANGILGAEAVATAAPDGYTLLVTSASFVVNPSMYRKLPYDVVKDFAPVTQLTAAGGLLLVVNPAVPARSVQELIALARKPDSRLAFGSPGIGNTLHLPGELLNARAGLKLLHIPYKGAGQALTALLAGDIQLMFITPALSLPHVRDGTLRALAYTGPLRAPFLPAVPTMVEAGVPGFEVDGGWHGVFAPAHTPREVIVKLQGEIQQAIASPPVRERLVALGLEPVGSGSAEFRLFVSAEKQKYAELVRLAGIQPE